MVKSLKNFAWKPRNYSKKKFTKKKTLAKKVKKLTDFVYRTIEPKQISSHHSQAVAPDTWYGFDLTEMPAGTAPTNVGRIGNAVTLTSLRTKISFNLMSPFVTYRVLIIQFPCLDLAIDPAIVIPHILTLPATSLVPPIINTNHVLMSGYKVGSALKFNILVDDIISPNAGSNPVKDLAVPPNDVYYGSQIMRTYNLSSKIKQKSIQFLTGAAASSAYKGIICMYIYNNNDLDYSPDINFDIFSRFNYRDA